MFPEVSPQNTRNVAEGASGEAKQATARREATYNRGGAEGEER